MRSQLVLEQAEFLKHADMPIVYFLNNAEQSCQYSLGLCLMAGKGLVGGVLWYFPCKDGNESIPPNTASLLSSTGGGLQMETLTSQLDGVSQQATLTQRPLNGNHDWCLLPVLLPGLSVHAHCHYLTTSCRGNKQHQFLCCCR